MCIYSRLSVYTGLMVTLFIAETGRSYPAAEASTMRWQLRTFDGYRAPDWVRRPANLLLPELRNAVTGTPLQQLHQPQVGACQPTLGRRLLGSAHLIPTLLGANDDVMQNELRYLHLLEQLNSYEISGRSLRLYDANHPAPRLVFVLKPVRPE